MRWNEAALLVAVGVVGWTYVGYPVFLAATGRKAARRRPEPLRAVIPDRCLPSVTVVVAALDEEEVIERKLEDVARLDYPRDKLEVIVVADGSTDRTAELARRAGATVLWSPDRAGKSAAVNRGISMATTELICLTDANCSLTAGTLRALAAAFDDPAVAVVSGAKTVTGAGARGRGEGLYWRLESFVKAQESRVGAAMGAPGEVCGLRRAYVRPIPAGVLNDDYHLTCDALVRGLLVRFAPDAIAFEEVPVRIQGEFERRSRVAAGTWQTTLAHMSLANPRRGWVAVTFWSHRVLRSLVVPPLLPVIAIASAVLARTSPLAKVLLVGQALGYGAAALGLVVDSRATGAPLQLVLTNVSTLAGAVRLLTGRQPVQWRRVQRGKWVAA
ncbi:MAG: glycosyltransferase [Actinomycetota bacterium]|nr:glycosyltransferase [Actinomycetota bacterium]